MKLTRILTCVVLSSLLCLSPLLADGETRQAKPEEIAFQKGTLQIIEKACPSVPEGWTVADKTDTDAAFDRVVPGLEKYPLTSYFTMEWENQTALQEADEKIQKVIEEIAKGQLDRQAKDERQKKIEEMTKRFGEALEKGDTVAAQKIQTEELDPLQKQLSKEGASMDKELKAKTDPLKARDARVHFKILTNQSQQELMDYVREPNIDGVMVFRREAREFDRYEGETMAFLGPWKEASQEHVKSLKVDFDPKASYLSVQSLTLELEGSQARCRQILEKMDWNALKSIIK